MSNDKPAWLKRMENGSIGEATAKEFLIDRFWILERSVDIHGADLIIQRRLTSENLLDTKPPRFGVIQVKYFQDEETSQYISKKYILDDQGNERKEFFILAVTGYEDSKKLYLLSSQDVIKDFKLIDDSSKENFDTYKINGRILLRNQNFLITHKKTALDKIENSLNLSSFSSNRRFLSHVVPEISKEIDTPYIINIANDQADFKEWQNEIKNKIDSAVYELNDNLEKLNQVLSETDPLKIEGIIEELNIDSRGNLLIPLDIDTNFFEEARNYKYKHDFLESRNLLQRFLSFQDDVINTIKHTHIPHADIKDDQVLIIEVTFDDSLTAPVIQCKIDLLGKITSKTQKLYSGIIDNTSFDFLYYYVPTNYSYTDLKNEGKFKWNRILNEISKGMTPNTIMNRIYETLHDEVD